MKTKFVYSTNNFRYDKELNFFLGEEKDFLINGYSYSFPNQKKEFFIENPLTKGFRRFRLKYEKLNFYLFQSEDKIWCLIRKN